MIDGAPVTPPDLEVRALICATEDGVLFEAGADPTEVHVWRWATGGTLTPLTRSPGVHTAVSGGRACVLGSATLEHDGTRWTLGGHRFASHAQAPIIRPTVQMLTVGDRGCGSGSCGHATIGAGGGCRC